MCQYISNLPPFSKTVINFISTVLNALVWGCLKPNKDLGDNGQVLLVK